jgi:pyridoxamine 5'-phosphate oxidase
MNDLASLRKNYAAHTLDITDVDADPVRQFQRWFAEAQSAQMDEPNAMTLATASRDGVVSARVVLLKGLDARGFVFFTNYESDKGRELEANPSAALVFLWHGLERQVRVQGQVERVSAEESDAYFFSRPLASQLGAWASPQSAVVSDRSVLEQLFEETSLRYQNSPPRPPHWGGYRVVHQRVEFWQGRPSRLHDRIRYTVAQGRWTVERLAP